MAETLYNDAEVPTNSDAYNLTADLRKFALSLNLPITVANQAVRDYLPNETPTGVLRVGQIVLRSDQSMVQEVWDGTKWVTGTPHSEWTRTGQVVPNTTAWGVGALTQDATKTTDTGFATHPSADTLKFRDAGNYAVTFTATADANMTGRSFVEIRAGGVPLIRTVVTGEDRGAAVIPNYRAAANETLTFVVYQSSGANRTIDFRIRATRVG